MCLSTAILPACEREQAPSTSSSSSVPTPSGSAEPTSKPKRRTPPIAVNTALGEFNEGLALELRATVSNVTNDDPLTFALRLRPETKPPKGDPLYSEDVDFGETLRNFEFRITDPQGKEHVLKLASGPATPWVTRVLSIGAELQLAREGVRLRNVLMKWPDPPEKWLARAGTYRVTLSGELAGKARQPKLTSGALEFQVEAPSARRKTLVELAALATKWVKERQGVSKLELRAPVIEDTAKNRSFRFVLNTDRYDVTVVEVHIDPTGKELLYDVFKHFTCVAEGMRIATPSGPVPIEQLLVGAEVESFDVKTGRSQRARVTGLQSFNAGRLVQLGGLSLTPNHPVFADGSWRAAGEVKVNAQLVGLGGTSLLAPLAESSRPTVVYDLSVTDPHTYFAEGVLLHNKAAYVPIGDDLEWSGVFYRRAAPPR